MPSISSIQPPSGFLTPPPPPPPPSRRVPGSGPGEQSAVTKASGLDRASLRPPPPTTGVMSSRMATHPVRSGHSIPSGIVPRAPAVLSIPVEAAGTMVSAAPTTPPSRLPLVLGAAALVGVVGIVAALLLKSDPVAPPVAQQPEPAVVRTSPPPPAANAPTPEPTKEAISADELPKETTAEAEAEPEAASDKPSKRQPARPGARRGGRSPSPKPASKPKSKPSVDLDNPYR